MSGRYSPTERIGVNAVERIVLEELGWIFREQIVADVGIDAIVEQCESGNPTGKLIAVQIKTQSKDSNSTFSISENKLIYYSSNIHYNYWLNFDIPVILIGYIIETKQAYWQHVCEYNFRKTDRRWKIEIPKNKKFGSVAATQLNRILNSNNHIKNFTLDLYNGKIKPENIFDFMQNLECIQESNICIENINNIFNNHSIRLMRYSEERIITDNEFDDIGLSYYKTRARIAGMQRDFNIFSERMEKEIFLFSKFHSDGYHAYEQLFIWMYKNDNDLEILAKHFLSIKQLSISIKESIKSVTEARARVSIPSAGIEQLSERYNLPSLKNSIDKVIEIIDLITSEFSEAEKMIAALKNKIECKLKEYASNQQPPSLP